MKLKMRLCDSKFDCECEIEYDTFEELKANVVPCLEAAQKMIESCIDPPDVKARAAVAEAQKVVDLNAVRDRQAATE